VNCVVSACDLVNCDFIYYCHVRQVELYGSSHVLQFGVFIIFLIPFSWISIVIDIFSDRLLSFSKLPEYRRRIRFRQYRIDFVFEKKM
jgi:hypothetical protein